MSDKKKTTPRQTVKAAAAAMDRAADSFLDLASFAEGVELTFDPHDCEPNYYEAVKRRQQAERHAVECHQHAQVLRALATTDSSGLGLRLVQRMPTDADN
jgi:hypothetical protein